MNHNESELDDLEDSNFLKGKSLWTEESFSNKNNCRNKNGDAKIYKRKKSKFNVSKSRKKNDTKLDEIINNNNNNNLVGLPVKTDTLDKFAKLQKRNTQTKKKSGRNNSLISLRSALSKKSNK